MRSPGEVYPRVCGGTRWIWCSGWTPGGLSPRVRGNRQPGRLPPGWSGSIPACAGEPGTSHRRSAPRWVYPRVCGGTRGWGQRSHNGGGLSPRVRGNQNWERESEKWLGSIPACAGEPPRRNCHRPLRTVYPRVCGGTPAYCGNSGPGKGLSPRVRGNPRRRHPPPAHQRSIPACAGEPARIYIEPPLPAVYPRVCGGTLPQATLAAPGRGLSPRVRGNHRQPLSAVQRERSIPACAGEPVPPQCIIRAKGLSPRVRGNPDRGRLPLQGKGSIPACAGEPATS